MLRRSVENLTLIGFMILLLLLLISAVALYINHYGFNLHTLYQAYAGNSEQFIEPKSFTGILKSFTPHMIVMPLIFFTLFHLVLASKSLNRRWIKVVAIMGFGSCFTDIFINFVIFYSPIIAFIKMMAFMFFELSLLFLMAVLFKNIYFAKA